MSGSPVTGLIVQATLPAALRSLVPMSQGPDGTSEAVIDAAPATIHEARSLPSRASKTFQLAHGVFKDPTPGSEGSRFTDMSADKTVMPHDLPGFQPWHCRQLPNSEDGRGMQRNGM